MNSVQKTSSILLSHLSNVGGRYLIVLFVLIGGIWASLPCPTWAKMDIQTDDKSFWLDDGGSLEIREDAIVLYGPATGTQKSRIRWSVSADKPRQALLFETPAHVQCLFYISPKQDQHVELHAVRVTDGHEIWMNPIIIGASIDRPVDPVFVFPWIYLGRGTWLEQIDPEDGSIVQRYPMRELIKSLYVSGDNSIEVVVEASDAGQMSIRFQDGVWFPRINASSSLSGSSLLSDRATELMWDFAGTLEPWYYEGYQGYLDLLRIKKETVFPDDIITFRNFDLKEAETRYKEAARRDQANPYLTLYQAFALYYQDQHEAASALIEETLRRSAGFWEESIRLGAICDSLGHTAWADVLYEQGITLFFREIPAPSQEVTVDEVLAVLLQEQSSTLFASGHTKRALQLLDIRRQIFPYTEGDNLFSRKYVAWLQANGQEEKARQEQQRITRRGLGLELVTLTPFRVLNFAGVTIVFLYLIILKNDIRHRFEFIALVIIIALIDSVAMLDVLGELSLLMQIGVYILGLLGYIIVIALLRRRREPASQPLWRGMINTAMSSYIVLIRGTLPAYYLGLQLTKSEVGAKWAELLFIVGFLGIYWLLRKRHPAPPLLRHGRLLILGLLLYIGWSAWLHYWGTYGIITMNLPRPWADRGHPNWVAYIDKQVEKAEFRKQDIQFLQALVYQLRGDAEFAKQLYQPLTSDARALNNLGVLASEQSRDTAQSYFQQALQQEPDYAPACYNLAVLAGNTQGISEEAQAYWLPEMYQRYAPERLWIANPALKEWCSTLYWSRGGFWYKSFLEPMVRFTNPAKLFQADLQQLR